MSRRRIFTVVLLIACCCVIYLSESLSSHGFWLRLRTKFRNSDLDSSDSSTSGQLFKGIRVRKFPRSASRYSKLTRSEIESLTRQKRPLFIKHAKPKACDKWVVITTVFAPSDSVRKASQLDGWCVVVVADKKGPASYDVKNIVYLSVRDQEELANYYSFVQRLPWNHFGRKNIGYLYAIFQGAQYIFDMDDDNVLKQLSISRPNNVMKVSVVNCTAFNVYPPMEATEHPSWPRGFPLDQIKQNCAWSSKLHELDDEESVIFQSLADHDPDVDAIYRMTLSLPFYFQGHTSFSIPSGVFVPYNAQASLHHRKSFWGLLLPITVHSRVSDIWRSYFTQRLLWEIGSRLAFVPPWVNQFRNPHNYLRDFQAETDLYLKTSSLIEFLLEWKGNSTTLPGRLEELWIELYERNYIEKQDVELLQAWLDALIQVGYDFPNITNVHFFHKNFKQHSYVEKKSQRIVVTGINGLIGSHVAKELVKNPHYEVYGLIRPRSNLATLTNILHKIKLVHGDITDAYRMKQIIERIRPHIIMHFAAQAINSISYDTPQLTIDTNIRGTLNLLEAVRQTGLLNTRFLYAGSSTEYGRTADLLNRSISENAPLKPVSPYGVSKVAAELLALQYYYSFGLPVIIARFFIQVGVGGTDSLAMHDFSKQVAMIEHGLLPPILRHGNIESKRDMSDIRLVAPMVVKLAEKGVGGEVYNVGTGNGVSMKDVLSEILSQARVNISIEEEESRLRVYDERYLSADISKLKALTGYEPHFEVKNVVNTTLRYWRKQVHKWFPNKSVIVDPYDRRKSNQFVNNCFNSSIRHNYTRILITGVNGMIGSHVAKELCRRSEYEIYGLVRQRSNLNTLIGMLHKIKLVHGDITDAYRMKQIIEQIRPHIIMHFAAQAINSISYDTPQLTIDTNIRGTLNLLEAVRQTDLLNTRFLFAGSSTEYGRTADLLNRSISENAPLKPVSPYGVSKVAAELLALQYYYSFGLPVIVARFFIQVGVGGTDSLAMHDFSKQVAMIEHGLLPPILRHGNIESKRDMSDIRLVAPMVVKLAEKGVGGEVYNVGTGNGVSMKDVLSEILSQARVNISVEEEESRLRVYDERYLSADISKLKALTGYEPQFDLKSIVDVVLNYWRREVMDLRPSVRAAIVTIFSERRRYLLRTLPTWNRCLPWMHKKYPVIVFISDIVNDTEQQHIRTLAGNLQIRFVVFQYGWNQTRDRSGGGGGPWVNWLLTKEMYEFPELRNLEYMMRLDEDIFFYNISYFDIFQDMKDNNILVGWKQWIFGNDVAIGSGLPDRVVKYNSLWSESRGYNLSDVWSKVTDPLSSHHTLPAIQSYPKARDSLWRPYLVAGCVEMYATSIFRTPHYHKWLSDLRIADGLSQSHYWEQEVKTLWLHTYVPLANWKTYACALPLYHQDQRPESISHWFFDDCDYITGRPLSTTRCDIDAELRIC